MKKFLLSAVVAFAAFASNAGAQAIVITKSNDAKIVLPSGNVKEITTTTEEVGESLDYYTKEENDAMTATLAEAFNQRVYMLQGQLNTYLQALSQINQCQCGMDGGLPSIVEDLQANVNIINTQIDDLSKRLNSVGNNPEVDMKLKEMETVIANIVNIINNVDGRGTSLMVFLSNVETNRISLEAAIYHLMEEGHVGQARTEELKSIIGNQQAIIAQLQAQAEEAKCKIAEQNDRISILEEENSSLKKEITDLHVSVSHLEKMLNELESKK